MSNRVIAVDPGEQRIGVAISDLSGTIASPLTVVKHEARSKDAARIVQLAQEQHAVLIVIGQPLDSDGQVGAQGRKSQRLADAIQEVSEIPVALWDESGSTKAALSARRAMGVKRKNRKGHLDDLAATYLLQSYLDAHDVTMQNT